MKNADRLSEKEDKRVVYPDALRILSIFMIVLLHVATKNMWAADVGTPLFNIFTGYSVFTRFGVPLFFMISGSFLLDPNKEIQTKLIFTKYIARIVSVLLIWSAIYACITVFTAWDFSWDGAAERLFTNFYTGPYHFWFLFVLLGLYLILPFLRAIVKQCTQKDLLYFLIICFTFVTVLPTLTKLSILKPISVIMESMQLHFVMGYVGLYILGYYLRTFDTSKNIDRLFYLLGIVSLAASWVLTFQSEKISGVRDEFWMSHMAITVLPQAIALFLLFKNAEKWLKRHSGLSMRIVSFSQLTFGVYLVHDVFITILYTLGLHTLKLDPLLSIIPLSVSIFFLSSVLIFFLRRIPFIRNIV
jgi:surface polysaccharide O-acyltransferase-like enzyme